MDAMGSTYKSYPLIPEGENKCVWMKTGLVSYKLCDKNYHCETCPFDRAMRNGGSDAPFESGMPEDEGSLFDDSPSDAQGGSFLFHPDHCWVKVETHDRVKTGLDALITLLFANVQLVVLPTAGSFVEAGECFAHIILEEYVVPVISPLSGVIVETNQRLRDTPGLLASDPKGEGWLVAIRPDNLENDMKGLIFGRKAITWKQREESDISSRAYSFMKSSSSRIGPTMQDGGLPVTNLRDMLDSVSPRQRLQILDSILSRNRHS